MMRDYISTSQKPEATPASGSSLVGSGKYERHPVLQDAGIIGRAFRELMQRDINPATVRAWHWWTWMPDQEWMDNPGGYVMNRLRDGDEPPAEFLDLAQLTPEEMTTIKDAWLSSEQYQGWPSLEGNEKLRRLAPLWIKVRDVMREH